MIAALARLTGASPALPLLLLALVAGSTFAWGAHEMRASLADAREAGRTERDAHWRAQIAATSAAARARQIAAETDAQRAQTDAAAAIARLDQSLADQEARNAALPDAGACGLDRDRVRLLGGTAR